MGAYENITKKFTDNPNEYFSANSLSKELKIGKNAVFKVLHKLESEEFPIEAVPNKGYIYKK